MMQLKEVEEGKFVVVSTKVEGHEYFETCIAKNIGQKGRPTLQVSPKLSALQDFVFLPDETKLLHEIGQNEFVGAMSVHGRKIFTGFGCLDAKVRSLTFVKGVKQ